MPRLPRKTKIDVPKCHACHKCHPLPRKTKVDVAKGKMVVDKDGGQRWCVQRWCVKDGWHMLTQMVCARWCVTKLCVKVVCDRWCLTKMVKDGGWQTWWLTKMVCVKDGERWWLTKMVCDVCESCVWKMVCDKDGGRWWLTKMFDKDGERWWKMVKDGGWQRWRVKNGERWWLTKMVCERWGCVKDVCERWGGKDGWQRCVWKMVVDKDGVKDGGWQRWCVKDGVWRREAGGRRRTRDTESKTRTPHKVVGNKSRTQSCGEHACHAKRKWMWPSATPATQNEGGCRQAPRLPRKVPRRHRRLKPSQPRHPVPKVPRLRRKTKVDVTKYQACHAKRRWMSPSATPATQSAAASPATIQARHPVP